MVDDRDMRTFFEHKAARRVAVASFNPLDDYDAEVSGRVVAQGMSREWPACACGADLCPDTGNEGSSRGGA